MPDTWQSRLPQDDVPLDLWEVLAEELDEQLKSAKQTLPADFITLADAAVAAKAAAAEHAGEQTPEQAAIQAAAQAAKQAVEARLFSLLEAQGRTALCFSGGGVRSATFGLGVLQGLATCKGAASTTPLAQFDYLSTVSGGGYLGSWFSTWAQRAETPGANDGPVKVERLLQQSGGTLDPDPEPLGHIRRYAAFLTPKLGLLSADAWTLAATILRNMVLNWLVLIPFLMAAVLLPKAYHSLLFLDPSPELVQGLLIFGTACAFWATAYIAFHLPTICGPSKAGEGGFVLGALVPLTLAAITLPLHWHWKNTTHNWNYEWYQFIIYGGALHGAGWVAGALIAAAKGRIKAVSAAILGTIPAIVSGIIGGMAGFGIAKLFNSLYQELSNPTNPDLFSPHYQMLQPLQVYLNWFTSLAFPGVLGAFLIAALLVVGGTSKITSDEDREWWARAGGWIMIVTAAWLTATTTVLLGPAWLQTGVAKLIGALSGLSLGTLASWLGFSGSSGAGRRGDKDAQAERCNPVMGIAVKLAGPVFLWVLLVLLATANHNILEWLHGIREDPHAHTVLLDELAFLLGLGFIVAISSPLVNVNRFSLHAMYRDRLIRTYLGASRPNRADTANRFTDFDEADNVEVAKLSKGRPMHVVNMALNLVGGKNLAWQQRKAESFTATRLRTGSLRIGYQKTSCYGGKSGGLSLGSAIAISGAAASPNMGYHSSPLLTLIMTLFNARLGWWLANPGPAGKGKWNKEGPSVAFIPMLNEAFGRTNDSSKWVYLSDGGHFENLGLYEMVLRRCRTIVVVDGSQDSDYNFEDLGNAIRKVRVDLGISIEFKQGIPIFSPRNVNNRYCGVADILYDPKNPAKTGKLVYIKACLNGTEPEDVINYASVNPEFPQQSTAELWFDESQFESYRKLGAHEIQEIVDAAPKGGCGSPIACLLAGAQAYIAAVPVLPHIRWPKPARFLTAMDGTAGGSNVQLKGSITQLDR